MLVSVLSQVLLGAIAKMPKMLFFIFLLIIMTSEVTKAQDDQCPRPEEIAPCQCRTRGPTIQVRCTNSMMGRITEAMNMLRKRVVEVDVLILEDNNIPHLPSRAFGSVKINRLFIENNRIMTIDRNAFAGIEEFLTELYIKESGLKSLPKDSVDFLSHLTVLSIENSQIMAMPRVVGMKSLKLIKIDGSEIRDIPPRTLSDLPALKYLHISRSAITRLDTGILENLRYLVLANFTDNRISWIHPRAFRYMEELEEVVLKTNAIKEAGMVGRALRVVKPLKKLDLSHNEIEDLAEDSFVDIINLEELDLSHNLITDLRRGAVHGMPRLRSVNLSNNKIKTFHSDSFISTPMIDELKLNHNNLIEISDVSFIMDALPKLRLLDLSNNDIRDIPFGALRGYPALERLFLASNQISRVSLQALADMPSLMELDLSENKLIADAIDGPIFDLPNLKILNLAKNKLSMLDAQLLTTLNRLKRLDVSFNGITSISEEAFQGVGQLDYLNISYNNLREFEPNTFKGLTRLFELDASHNELVALPDYLLSDQRNLEYVSFAYNQIQLVSMHLFPSINRVKLLDFTSNFIMAFPEALVTGMPNLEKLLFRRNSLQRLNKGSFSGLRNLEVLDLHDNRIQDIEEDAFKDLGNLKGLDLSLNIISSVGDTLDPLTNLMKLNLSDNYITSLPRNAFHALEKLSTLDVSNNTIVEIGVAFTKMPQLKYLDISYNHLPIVKKGAFKDLPSLVGLRLDYNSIIELQPEAFQDLWNLETLILTKNGIPRIKSNTFRNMPSLEKLKLDDNLIERLERSAFSDLFSLKELHLQQNILQDLDSNAFVRVPSVRYLNMSYNLLRDLPRNGFFGLDTLETLDLSYNDLRNLDSSLFDNMKWLVELKLNDNNICRINRYAFRDTASLRSLSLKNNRLTRLPHDAFQDIQKQIVRFDVAGNPLNCDCETLWLRNWVADESNPLQDDPICYFPKQLSGNPLKQLRTSRFTCDARSADMIQDACRGVPIKTPVQQHIQSGLDSGIFDTEAVTDAIYGISEAISSKPLLNDDDIESIIETKVAAEDIKDLDDDVIDTVPVKNKDYEYYYVYYDEDGNVVEKSPPKTVVQSSALDKVQEIPVVLAETPAINSNANKGEETGDTPTIYAGLQNSDSSSATGSNDEIKKVQAEGENEEGMSIFGIPIPKIPFPILSFGLTPTTFSHGLLPIGRKGDPSAAAESDASINRRKTSVQPEITRGPDTIDPIWLESLINGGKALFKSHMNKDADDEEEEVVEENRREFNQYFPESSGKPLPVNLGGGKLKFGYLPPQNPRIPLTASEEDYDFPLLFTEGHDKTDYFPPGASQQDQQYVPAIKFDHPNQNDAYGGHLPNSPIQPSPDLMPANYHYSSNHANQPPIAEDGFIPLFLPDKNDPTKQRLPVKSVAFPELDSTHVQKLPTSFYPQSPALDFSYQPQPAEYPMIYRKPPQQLPEDDIPIVHASSAVVYPAVPESVYPVVKGTEKPLRRPTKSPPTTASTTTEEPVEQSANPGNSEAPADYYYAYEEEEIPTYAPPPSNEVSELLESLGISQPELSQPKPEVKEVTTEREIPTLKVEEVVPKLEAVVEVTHRGSDIAAPTEATSTTSLPYEQAEPSEDQKVVYEYEYYYEYEDLNNKTEPAVEEVMETTTEELMTTTAADAVKKRPSISSAFTLDNFLSLISGVTDDPTSQTTEGSTPQVTIPRKPLLPMRPTLAPPIRTSSESPELSNYLENQRSSVTVETTHLRVRERPLPRSTTSRMESVTSDPYPFSPDRLDPRGVQPTSNNEVNWYYSNYNSEGLDPFVDPRLPRDHGKHGQEAAHVSSASASNQEILLPILTTLLLLL